MALCDLSQHFLDRHSLSIHEYFLIYLFKYYTHSKVDIIILALHFRNYLHILDIVSRPIVCMANLFFSECNFPVCSCCLLPSLPHTLSFYFLLSFLHSFLFTFLSSSFLPSSLPLSFWDWTLRSITCLASDVQSLWGFLFWGSISPISQAGLKLEIFLPPGTSIWDIRPTPPTRPLPPYIFNGTLYRMCVCCFE